MARRYSNALKYLVFQSQSKKSALAALALGSVDAYARVIGCSCIEIQEPLPDVIPLYERLGFGYDAQRRLVISVEHT